MSKLARDHRNSELATIHIARASLGWSDDHYRSVLRAVCATDTAATLDSAGRQFFIAHLKKCGWNPKLQATPPQGWQAKKIEDLWATLGKIDGALQNPSKGGLNAFIQNTVKVSDIRFLDTRSGIQIVEALKAWIKRVSRP